MKNKKTIQPISKPSPSPSPQNMDTDAPPPIQLIQSQKINWNTLDKNDDYILKLGYINKDQGLKIICLDTRTINPYEIYENIYNQRNISDKIENTEYSGLDLLTVIQLKCHGKFVEQNNIRKFQLESDAFELFLERKIIDEKELKEYDVFIRENISKKIKQVKKLMNDKYNKYEEENKSLKERNKTLKESLQKIKEDNEKITLENQSIKEKLEQLVSNQQEAIRQLESLID